MKAVDQETGSLTTQSDDDWSDRGNADRPLYDIRRLMKPVKQVEAEKELDKAPPRIICYG